jgi:3-hydroxymyristoyl/3-hydroxydecanoyl-(acyl carrier protein) dehydratase
MRRLPEILAERRPDAARVELDLRIPADLEYFAGHFPGAPVLPGVVQIDWCVRLGAGRLGVRSGFRALEQVKFLAPLVPSMTVSLLLELRDSERLKFAYVEKQKKYSSGTIVFGA